MQFSIKSLPSLVKWKIKSSREKTFFFPYYEFRIRPFYKSIKDIIMSPLTLLIRKSHLEVFKESIKLDQNMQNRTQVLRGRMVNIICRNFSRWRFNYIIDASPLLYWCCKRISVILRLMTSFICSKLLLLSIWLEWISGNISLMEQ